MYLRLLNIDQHNFYSFRLSYQLESVICWIYGNKQIEKIKPVMPYLSNPIPWNALVVPLNVIRKDQNNTSKL